MLSKSKENGTFIIQLATFWYAVACERSFQANCNLLGLHEQFSGRPICNGNVFRHVLIKNEFVNSLRIGMAIGFLQY